MNEKFKLVSNYEPKGDQPSAIAKLVEGINSGKKEQVLLGATGTGKTFTIANVIEKVNKEVKNACNLILNRYKSNENNKRNK